MGNVKVNVGTKVCKICGKEKPIGEYYSKGKGYHDTKCKVCYWFKTNTKFIVKDGWDLDEYNIIVDNLLNHQPIFLNDIAILLSKDLFELCDVISNYLKLNGKTRIQVRCNCNTCNEELIIPSSKYIASKSHFCSKSCNNVYRKGKNFHKIIGVGNCLSCNKEFNISDHVPDQKFCCTECKSKYYYYETPKYEDKTCTNCGVEYTRQQQTSRTQNCYCSLECELEYKHKQSYEVRKCEICDEEFEILKSSTQKMCSIQCQGKWQSINLVGENANGYNHDWSKEDRTLTCEWCGKVHQAKPYQIENGRRFCSDECRQDWFAKEFSISEENMERARIQAVKNLSDGIMNKTDTSIQILTNKMLNELHIEYDNEYNCKYVAIDNYLKDYNLMIEVNGQYWHTDPRFYKEINYEMQVKRIKMDKIKHTYIKNNYDIEILYLWEDDINNKPDMCIKLIQLYIKNSGVLNNYHSFNYSIIDSELVITPSLIVPYMEYEAMDIRDITDTTVKEKMCRKQLDKWITFNCEHCGIETEQLISHHKGKHHYCSKGCFSKASRNKPKSKNNIN